MKQYRGHLQALQRLTAPEVRAAADAWNVGGAIWLTRQPTANRIKLANRAGVSHRTLQRAIQWGRPSISTLLLLLAAREDYYWPAELRSRLYALRSELQAKRVAEAERSPAKVSTPEPEQWVDHDEAILAAPGREGRT